MRTHVPTHTYTHTHARTHTHVGSRNIIVNAGIKGEEGGCVCGCGLGGGGGSGGGVVVRVGLGVGVICNMTCIFMYFCIYMHTHLWWTSKMRCSS